MKKTTERKVRPPPTETFSYLNKEDGLPVHLTFQNKTKLLCSSCYNKLHVNHVGAASTSIDRV